MTVTAGPSGPMLVNPRTKSTPSFRSADPGSPATGAVFTGTDGSSYTASVAGQSIVIAADSSSTTISHGAVATFAGQTFSAAASAIVIDGSSTLAVPSAQLAGSPTDPASASAIATVTAANGQQITAYRQSGIVVLGASGSVETISNGVAAMISGHTITIPIYGSALVVDGTSTIPLPASDPVAMAMAAMTAAGGQQITAYRQSGLVVLSASGSAETLPTAAVATFDGQTFALPSDGSALAFDGSSEVMLPAAIAAATAVATLTAPDNQLVTAYRASGDMILGASGSAVTLLTGVAVTFEDQTYALQTGGSALVIDGSATVSLKTPGIASETAVATFTTPDGSQITAYREGGYSMLSDGTSAATLPVDGTAVPFKGGNIALQTGSSALVTNGTSTMPLLGLRASYSGSGDNAATAALTLNGAGPAGAPSTTASSEGSTISRHSAWPLKGTFPHFSPQSPHLIMILTLALC